MNIKKGLHSAFQKEEKIKILQRHIQTVTDHPQALALGSAFTQISH